MQINSKNPSYIFIYSTLGLGVAVMVFPVVWMLIASTSLLPLWRLGPPETVGTFPLLANYKTVWQDGDFSRFFLNSLIVSLSTTFLSVSLAAPAAYGFTRFDYRFGYILQIIFLVPLILPQIFFITPYSWIVRILDLFNTYQSLTFAYISFILPFCIWILIASFYNIPEDLDEQAKVDGCTTIDTFRFIILPIGFNSIIMTSLFAFILGWQEFLIPICFTTSREMSVMTLAIVRMLNTAPVAWRQIMAASAIAAVPLLVLSSLAGRYVTEGLAEGAMGELTRVG